MSEHLSPSEKYKLETSHGDTWASKGTVTRVSDGKEIAVVERNYQAFPFCWIEGHANGHDYLLCGSDYQSHTVIELDTGARRDTPMEGKEHGHGFCMASAEYNAEWKVVVVDGCVWAAPYEFRLYDFADPMGACPQLEMTGPPDAEAWAESDTRLPEFDGDTVLFFQSSTGDGDIEATEGAPTAAAVKVFRREGPAKLVYVEERVTPAEQEVRRKHAEARDRYEAKIKAFRTEDPLYLLYKELLATAPFQPEEYESHGVTFRAWCPHWAGYEMRWCRSIHKAEGLSIDLEWAITTGPIKLTLYPGGTTTTTEFFPHTTDGMREAFARAQQEVIE